MGRRISELKKSVFRAAAVAGIVFLLVFAVGCSGDLLGYIKALVAQGECECKGIIDLPKTGQTTSYETGDDGDLQMGVAWPGPRFTDNSNGTITDNLTGLIWLKDSTRFGQRTWADALSDCNNLAHDGINLTDGSSAGDWRLPNRKELGSLVNYEAGWVSDWLNGQGFTGLGYENYWSSTTDASSTTFAWYVYMYSGAVISISKWEGSLYVLAVRSGQAGGAVSLPRTGQTASYVSGDDGDLKKGAAWPDPRFTDIGNGTICDNLTGLMWEQAPSGASDWVGALSYANNLDLGGHSDWRLPNVNELKSLINAAEGNFAGWLNDQGFSGVQTSNYWSSTTWAATPTSAWYVHMGYGEVFIVLKTVPSYVLAVRGGE
jgi:hypothetical protein